MHTQTENKLEKKATTLEKKNVTDNLRKHTHFADFVVRKLKKNKKSKRLDRKNIARSAGKTPRKAFSSQRQISAVYSNLLLSSSRQHTLHPPQRLRDESRTNGAKLWINIFYIYMWKMRALSSLANVCSICHTSMVRAAILWCKGTASSSQQFDGCWRRTCESHLHYLFGLWEGSFVWCRQLNLKSGTKCKCDENEI